MSFKEWNKQRIASLNGFAACNLAEPTKDDLPRIYAAYKECWNEVNSLRQQNEAAKKLVAALREIANKDGKAIFNSYEEYMEGSAAAYVDTASIAIDALAEYEGEAK